MQNSPKQLRLREIDIRVRPVQLRLPFKFGAVTLRACPQVFVRATVEVNGSGTASGHAAEMMVPKWFDKRTDRSHTDNVNDLARSLNHAREAYLADPTGTAFAISARCYHPLYTQAKSHGMTDLSAAFGPAVLDRAILDALCKASGISVFDAMRTNLAGITDSPLAPDLSGFDWHGWLARMAPLHQIQARHTVGMLDPLEASSTQSDPLALPNDLGAVIRRYGHRIFKIKLGGDPVVDLARLTDVLALLEREAPGAQFSLDGNEQYGDPAALLALFDGLHSLPQSRQTPQALLYIEQPVPRDQSLGSPLPANRAPAPLLLDEADGRSDAFLQGRECGWRGVSSKGCKGLYKAFINRARCDMWNRDDPGDSPFFMSAEDLTCQAGLAVQQDLALASMLGLKHSERNGHHYVDGMAAYPVNERAAFSAAHPDLYETSAGHPRLRIEHGAIAINSLFGTGFASGAEPDWDSTQALSTAATHV